jgi:hypothetical protein
MNYVMWEMRTLVPLFAKSCDVGVKIAMQYVYYCLYMLLDVHGALQDRIGRVLGQKC